MYTTLISKIYMLYKCLDNIKIKYTERSGSEYLLYVYKKYSIPKLSRWKAKSITKRYNIRNKPHCSRYFGICNIVNFEKQNLITIQVRQDKLFGWWNTLGDLGSTCIGIGPLIIKYKKIQSYYYWTIQYSVLVVRGVTSYQAYKNQMHRKI